MIAAGLDVLHIYQLVFWHALTVSFVAWLLLPVGLLMPSQGKKSVVMMGRVFGAVLALGLAIMAGGAVHGGVAARTPDYVHGLACVFGVASAMTLTWAVGRVIRLVVADAATAPNPAG